MSWDAFAKVLPQTAEVGETGHLAVGGCDLLDLADRFGTPLFVVDLDDVRGRLAAYAEAFGAENVAYASKAFLTRGFAKIVADSGVGIDCVAGGELFTALSGGFPAARVVVHGNNKSSAELTEAVEAGVGCIVVDGWHEFDRLDEVFANTGRTVPLAIRVAPGVEAKTHDYLTTGTEDSKFGFSIAETAVAAADRAAAIAAERFVGIHCHIGSQVIDLAPFAEAARVMVRHLAELRERTGLPLPELTLGGGLGIAYTPGDEPRPVSELADIVLGAVTAAADEARTPVPTVKVEPGRSIVGRSTVTLYTVGSVKDVPGVRRYVAVDGGMSDNIRPPLYGARYTFVSVNRPMAAHDVEATVAGKLCETGDLLTEHVGLPDVEIGEVLAAAATGAYTYAMASNYNKQPKPAVVGVSAGQTQVLARRETYDDLIRLEP